VIRRRRGDTPSPVVADMLEWADRFERGDLSDPAMVDGTLEPGERFAIRIGPLVEAELEVTPEGPRVLRRGITGSLVATDRRVILEPAEGGVGARQWRWDADVDGVTMLRAGLGVMWAPSEARHEAGERHLTGAVLDAFAKGEVTAAEGPTELLPMFMRVQVAWRASRPGGLDEWRREFVARFGP
jgi:hypothetical protein